MSKNFYLLFTILLLVPVSVFSQLPKAIPVPDVKPMFPGGEEAMYKYIYSTIRYPAKAREHGMSGEVEIEFMVDEKGVLSDFKILKSVGGGCDEEFLRVIKSMNEGHQWIPGKTNGVDVKSMYTLSVKFRLG